MSESLATRFKHDWKNVNLSAFDACLAAFKEIETRLTALESGKPLPAAPVKRWIECDHTGGPTVWKWNKNIGKSVAVPAEYLDYGDLWMPYSPGEPAPEAPCEVKK